MHLMYKRGPLAVPEPYLQGVVVSLSMDVVGGEVALAAAKRARSFEKLPNSSKMTMRLLTLGLTTFL